MRDYAYIFVVALLSLCGLRAYAYEYHEPTSWVNTFDYSGYTFTYEEDGVVKTARLTDEAFTPAHQMALLKAVYADPTIPGIHYGYNYNGTQNRKLDYNHNAHQGETEDPESYWLGTPDEFYPNPIQNGMTMLIVQVKDTWKSSMHTHYAGAEYFKQAIHSIRLITNFIRVNDRENPGYLFTINSASNRFFFISKGKARAEWVKPFFRMFEQISPVDVITHEHEDDVTFIDELRMGHPYACFHDCANVFSLEHGHWFTISKGGEYYSLKNLSIFIPDRRFEHEMASADAPDDRNDKNFNEYGFSQTVGEEIETQLPHVVLYSAHLEAEAKESDTKGYFKVCLNWGSSFSTIDELPDFFYVYKTDGFNHELLTTIPTQPTTEFSHEFLVEQLADEQTFHFMVTASPIIFDDDGNVLYDADGVPVSMLEANSPIRTVVVPGRQPYFSQEAEFRSRYDISKEVNIYKNKVRVSPTTSDDYIYLKNATGAFTLTRTDDQGHKVNVASVQFSVNDAINGYDYVVTYNDGSQNTQLLFDDEEPVTQGSFNTFDDAKVYVMDRFTASTKNNTHSAAYVYRLEQTGGESSNSITAKVHKTTSTIAPIAFTKDEIESDVDRHLNAERFTEVTFDAENDPVSNITDYSLYCVIWNGTANKVAKAENVHNDGHYELFGLNANGTLSEDQGVADIAPEGGEISLVGRNVDPNSTTNNFVPVITTLVDSRTMAYNTYGSDIKNLKYAKLSASITGRTKTEPFRTARGQEMGFGTTISVAPVLSSDVSSAYLYRVWRENGTGDETYLEPVTLLNDLDNLSNPDWNTHADYDPIRGTFPGGGKSKVYVHDLFFDKVPESGAREVVYYVRMYATTPRGERELAPLNMAPAVGTPDDVQNTPSDRYFFVSELKLVAKFDKNVPTSIECFQVDDEVQQVVYYNLQGIASTRPYSGVNVVVTRYKDGRTVTAKRVY